MHNLNDRDWKAFFIAGEDGIFDICATQSGIDKNKLLTNGANIMPYITRSDTDNGVNMFVPKTQQTKYNKDSGNVITIGLDTQTVFYQPYSFFTGQNIHVLSFPNINKYSALFICNMLKIQMKKFNWGGNGATLGRLNRTKIMLPADQNGNPDYTFMENYIREREKQLIEKYKSFIGQISQTVKTLKPLASLEWSAFPINDIFTINSGKRLTKADMDDGRIPFIGATDSNNGITNWVATTNSSLDKNVLGVNYNGSVVENFYHGYNCIFSDDVKRLHLRNTADNKYILLFLKTIILQQKGKYTYGYKFNRQRMERQKILLPVDQQGSPDYAYMEQYGKKLMLQKYQQYLQYLNTSSKTTDDTWYLL